MAKIEGSRLKVPDHMDKGDRCVQLNYDFKDFPIPSIVGAPLIYVFGALLKFWTIDDSSNVSFLTWLSIDLAGPNLPSDHFSQATLP